MKAILSAHDRTGLVEFAGALHRAGWELVSTGGTGGAIADAGLPVQQVSELTGFPELMDGRVKTLHPKVHAGILARRDLDSHAAQLAEHGIDTIDLVAVNLYPFVETVLRPDVSLEEALENIDIGGPTLIRAAAKNFPYVIAAVDPADYGWIAERLGRLGPHYAGGAARAGAEGLPARRAVRYGGVPLSAGRRRPSGVRHSGLRADGGVEVRREPSPGGRSLFGPPVHGRDREGRAAFRAGNLLQQRPRRRGRLAGRVRLRGARRGGRQAQ